MRVDDRLTATLEQARWSPSGDNTQCWRFQAVAPLHIRVHGFDTRDWCVYDLDGIPSWLSIGALLETIEIAANARGLACNVQYDPSSAETKPVFDLHFSEQEPETEHLEPFITSRTTQRRRLSTSRIDPEILGELESSVGPNYSVVWFQTLRERLRVTRILAATGQLRLKTPECYEVHKRVIHWGRQFSESGIPDQAVGVDPLAARLMAWAMRDWRRIWFLNTFLGGTFLPALQLDVVPGIGCGAHFLLVAKRLPDTLASHVQSGRAMQRLWLETTRQGLQFQPSAVPLVMARYVRNGITFSSRNRSLKSARRIKQMLDDLVGESIACRAVYMGRIGYGPPPDSRSTRLPLESLWVA